MILYRIANCNYITNLDGMGARLYGARWNSKGNAVVYLASSRALAVLEVLVHLQPLFIPPNFCLAEIEVPNNSILTLDVKSLPANWQDAASPTELRTLGNQFIKESKFLMMKVPSSIVPEEFNYLLNPAHADIKKVKIITTHPFNLDDRLIVVRQTTGK
ncbi:RES family NAD+ phosphorylase [Mucilaginibacter sp. 14171R-50]|uniref:RES family NAD+ phosphorylase n=1 Tax=Mucilaginibacter sp. 14171R-50 TaxID=2703789 RepID=UPI00138C7757|nr:RES family NAD+ phosphorylase [Mucilaginibacter sp. 14171R-50]QHS56253.1 RES family NAD+ phosphorylase [Mucilaginibacter sp. 14171R-50]